MTSIYALTDPREADAIRRVRYIGKAKTPDRRFRNHLYDAKASSKTHCHRWIHVLLDAGLIPCIDILSTVEDRDASMAERAEIFRFRALGAPLTNLTDGGDGAPGVHPSEETRAKLSAASIGHKRNVGLHPSAETRAKISAALMGHECHWLGRRRSAETRAKMSLAAKARTSSPEVRTRMSAASAGNRHALGHRNALGYHHSDEARAKISAANISKKYSPETRAKISAIVTAQWVARKANAATTPRSAMA